MNMMFPDEDGGGDQGLQASVTTETAHTTVWISNTRRARAAQTEAKGKVSSTQLITPTHLWHGSGGGVARPTSAF